MFQAPETDIDPQAQAQGGFKAPDTDAPPPQWSDLPGNIIPDAKAVGSAALGAGLRVGKGILDFPQDTLHSIEQAPGDLIHGTSLGETPLGQDAKTIGNSVLQQIPHPENGEWKPGGIVQGAMDLGSKDAWINHPVQNSITGGGILEGGVEGLLKGEPGTGIAGSIGNTLKESGEQEATNVAGIKPRTIQRLTPRGGNEAETRENIGEMLHKDKVVGGFGETPKTIRDLQQSKTNEAGNEIKGLFNTIKNSGVDPSTDSRKALSPILNEWTSLADSTLPEDRAMSGTLADVYTKLEDAANKNGGKLSFDDVHDQMETVGRRMEKIHNPEDPRLDDLRSLYHTLAQSKDAIVNDVASRSGNKVVADQLKAANQKFHTYKTISHDVGLNAAKEGTEKASKLGLYGGLWALAQGDLGKAAEIIGGSRLIGPISRKIAPSMAGGSIKLGNVISKYGPLLTAAAKKGAQNLAMTNYVLKQQDPDYADALSSFDGQE